MGPGIVARLALRTDDELAALVRDGLPAKGMPGQAAPRRRPAARSSPSRGRCGPAAATRRRALSVTMADGAPLRRRRPQSHGDRRCSSSPTTATCTCCAGPATRGAASRRRRDWPTYHGEPRRQSLQPGSTRSTAATSRGSRRRGCSRCPAPRSLQVTPVVVDGVMYVTNANECYALDAGIGPPHLALSAAAHEGPRRRRRRRASTAAWPSTATASSWSPTTRTCSRSTASPAISLWETRDGRLAAELRRHVRAARRRQPRRVRASRAATKASAASSPPSISATGKEVWRFWTVPGARRAGLRDVARHGRSSTAAPHVADRHLRPRAADALLADRQPVPRLRRQPSGRATTSTPTRSSRSIRRPGASSGTSSTRRTTSGTGTRSSRRCWSTRRGRASRASCCCTPTATASSTCSIAPAARCCWRSRS